MMNDEINKSFTEVLDVINHMEEKLYVKIPKEFIKLITENRDKNYEITIDYSRGINESNLLKETRVILSLIYRNYICSEEEREKLFLEDKEVQKRHKEELNKIYAVNFKRKVQNKEKDEKHLENIKKQMVKYKKESLLQKGLNMILNLIKNKTK